MKNKIVTTVCNYYEVTHLDLILGGRQRKYTYPRFIIWYFLDKLNGNRDFNYERKFIILEDMARIFALKNHATVLHGIQTVYDMIETDKYFREEIKEIKEKIGTVGN